MQKPEYTIPTPREAQDMVGERFTLDGLDWSANDGDSVSFDGKVTLVRWWTDGCPYCKASLPAIEQIRDEIDEDNFQTLAVYHPKPPRDVEPDQVVSTANELGYTGPVAIDKDWSVLRREYLDHGNRSATSVSFVIDDSGIVRFVHPGPEFQPSDDPEKAIENRDFNDIRSAILALLREQQTP